MTCICQTEQASQPGEGRSGQRGNPRIGFGRVRHVIGGVPWHPELVAGFGTTFA